MEIKNVLNYWELDGNEYPKTDKTQKTGCPGHLPYTETYTQVVCLLRLSRLHAEIKIFNKNDLNFVLSLTANITNAKTNLKCSYKREETKNEKHNLESSFG